VTRHTGSTEDGNLPLGPSRAGETSSEETGRSSDGSCKHLFYLRMYKVEVGTDR